jgi:hypothetical protein
VGSREEARWFLDRGVDAFSLVRQLWASQDNEERLLWLIEAHRIPKRG